MATSFSPGKRPENSLGSFPSEIESVGEMHRTGRVLEPVRFSNSIALTSGSVSLGTVELAASDKSARFSETNCHSIQLRILTCIQCFRNVHSILFFLNQVCLFIIVISLNAFNVALMFLPCEG